MTKEPGRTQVALDQASKKAIELNLDHPDVKAFMKRWAGRYSDHNLGLLYVQNNEATELHTYRGWLAEGRQVRKGETSIVLLAPRTKENDEGEVTDRWIRPISLFDISQTDAVATEDAA